MTFIDPDDVEVEVTDAPFRRKHYQGGRVHRSTQDYEFIAIDGEGVAFNEPLSLGHDLYLGDGEELIVEHKPQPQPYVLLADSKGGHLVNREGIPTVLLLDHLLDIKQHYPKSILIGYAINYDINQWLKDVPDHWLRLLHTNNQVRIGHYFVKWFPRKSFYIRHGKRSCIIYDVFGFFQTSFLEACRRYLPNDDPDLALIEKGKDARALFSIDELDEFIIPYCDAELRMLVRLMDVVREDFHGVGIHPGQWHGPGAIANTVLKQWNIPINHKLPEEILDASQYAYAGGRFEHYWLGRYNGPVYSYDIHSAYPAGATYLPNLQAGTWEAVKEYEPGSFGVYRFAFRNENGRDQRPQPYFCRSEDGRISYPREVQGWVWSPEAGLYPDNVQEGWVFRPDSDERPFSRLKEMYDQRRILKTEGKSTERAYKLILNSIYGKLAQLVGGREDRPPPWHQLEYAGYITSYTRAKLYRAMMLNPEAIIACETDGIYSMTPLELPLSDELGDWELKEYSEIVYLQSGFYYATLPNGTVVCRFRGMDRDRKRNEPVGLPLGDVLDHLRNRTGQQLLRGGPKDGQPQANTPPLFGHTTRFVGLGFGLHTDAVWRSWEKKMRSISLDQDSWFNKRHHLIDQCDQCQEGFTMYDTVHHMLIGGDYGHSHPSRIPWRPLPEDAPACDLYGDYLEALSRDSFS